MTMCLQMKQARPARSPRPGKPIFVFLFLVLAACSASAGTRLFLPVFSAPVPAQIERELRILSAGFRWVPWYVACWSQHDGHGDGQRRWTALYRR